MVCDHCKVLALQVITHLVNGPSYRQGFLFNNSIFGLWRCQFLTQEKNGSFRTFPLGGALGQYCSDAYIGGICIEREYIEPGSGVCKTGYRQSAALRSWKACSALVPRLIVLLPRLPPLSRVMRGAAMVANYGTKCW